MEKGFKILDFKNTFFLSIFTNKLIFQIVKRLTTIFMKLLKK